MSSNPRAHLLEPEILIESDGPVRIVRLNRPDALNAVDERLHTALARLWPVLADDRDARAVVLTGNGRAFCAGGDISTITRAQEELDERRRMIAEAATVLTGMIECRLPIVGAINGAAMGLGCSLAVGCDVTLIAESAYMADPHVALGLVAGDGGAVLWPMLTSMLKAKEYLYTGDRMSAATAVELGLATRMTADGQVVDEALKVAHRLAGLPKEALQDTKRALNMHIKRAMAGVLEYALAAESECFVAQSHRDAVESFLARSKRA